MDEVKRCGDFPFGEGSNSLLSSANFHLVRVKYLPSLVSLVVVVKPISRAIIGPQMIQVMAEELFYW